jgi:hypothetical protein
MPLFGVISGGHPKGHILFAGDLCFLRRYKPPHDVHSHWNTRFVMFGYHLPASSITNSNPRQVELGAPPPPPPQPTVARASAAWAFGFPCWPRFGGGQTSAVRPDSGGGRALMRPSPGSLAGHRIDSRVHACLRPCCGRRFGGPELCRFYPPALNLQVFKYSLNKAREVFYVF